MNKEKHAYRFVLRRFYEGEGLHDEAKSHAVKRVLAWQLSQAMEEAGITKVEMARRMKTSRSQADRFLDPNDSVQLDTIQKAAKVVGKRVVLQLEDVKV